MLLFFLLALVYSRRKQKKGWLDIYPVFWNTCFEDSCWIDMFRIVIWFIYTIVDIVVVEVQKSSMSFGFQAPDSLKYGSADSFKSTGYCPAFLFTDNAIAKDSALVQLSEAEDSWICKLIFTLHLANVCSHAFNIVHYSSWLLSYRFVGKTAAPAWEV